MGATSEQAEATTIGTSSSDDWFIQQRSESRRIGGAYWVLNGRRLGITDLSHPEQRSSKSISCIALLPKIK